MADILDPQKNHKHTWKLVNEALGFEIEFTGRVIVEQVEDEDPAMDGLPLKLKFRKTRTVIRTELEKDREVTLTDKRKRCDPRFAGLIIDPSLSLRPGPAPADEKAPGRNRGL